MLCISYETCVVLYGGMVPFWSVKFRKMSEESKEVKCGTSRCARVVSRLACHSCCYDVSVGV